MGLEITAYEAVPPEVVRADERRRFCDTSMIGLGKEGHLYPQFALSEDEKSALIEYLKTL